MLTGSRSHKIIKQSILLAIPGSSAHLAPARGGMRSIPHLLTLLARANRPGIIHLQPPEFHLTHCLTLQTLTPQRTRSTTTATAHKI